MKSRVIKISWLMIATVLVSISFFAIFKVCWNARNKNKETEIAEVSAVSGYDLANATDEGDGVYNITNDAYNSYTNFLIKNYAGLRAFCGIVNSGIRNFSEKNVYLTADIDCDENYINVGFTYTGFWGGGYRGFKGKVFDGQNHTIYDFKCNYWIKNSFYSTGGYTYHEYSYGFFVSLEGGTTIRNLRLQDYSIYVDSKHKVTGGVVLENLQVIRLAVWLDG